MPRPNVLLLILDSARARNFAHHGHDRETSPFVDSLAESATVYEQARAPGRWSLPSHASIFTGLHVAEHRQFDEGRRLRPGHTIFEELAADHGYETGVFSYNGYVNGATESGLDGAFQTVEGYRPPLFPDAEDPQGIRGEAWDYLKRSLRNDQPIRSMLNGLVMKLAWDYPDALPEWVYRTTSAGKTPDDVYVDLFLDWERERDGPWAACLNFMDTHNAYRPRAEHDLWPDEEARRIQDGLEYGNWEFLCGDEPIENLARLETLYDGTIHQADSYVEHVVETLERRGELDDTLVVVTGDHGEGFGEPDRIRPNLPTVQHVVGSHESLLHVPLVVKHPGQTTGETVRSVASLTEFPNAVRRVLDGDTSEVFVPESGYALASTHGLNEVNHGKMERFCSGDTARFEGATHVLYENTEDGVRKHMVWGEEYVAVDVPDARSATVVDGEGRDLVEETFAGLADAGVVDRDDVELDAGVERRLEELGYR